MPLILALEPDERQASILSGVVMNQLRADLVLVDSKAAAVAAMARELPDLVLLTSCLPRAEEKEIIGRLRARDARVQTLAIPPLGRSGEEDQPSSGLLRAFRRKRAADKPAGCDPKAFAREIRGRLQRVERARAERSSRPVTASPVFYESRPPTPAPVDPWSWAAHAPVLPVRTAPADQAAPRAAVPPAEAVVPAPARRDTAPRVRRESDPVPPPFFSALVATYELMGRAARGADPTAGEPTTSALAGLVRGLRVPEGVALFTYPRACRIEQVRVARRPPVRHRPLLSMPLPPTTRALHQPAPA